MVELSDLRSAWGSTRIISFNLPVGFFTTATESEAEANARLYMTRLRKWHGQEDEAQFFIFGHDVSQSQLFN